MYTMNNCCIFIGILKVINQDSLIVDLPFQSFLVITICTGSVYTAKLYVYFLNLKGTVKEKMKRGGHRLKANRFSS